MIRSENCEIMKPKKSQDAIQWVEKLKLETRSISFELDLYYIRSMVEMNIIVFLQVNMSILSSEMKKTGTRK